MLSLHAAAQQTFNEMTYTPKATTFVLNAPTQPVLRLYDNVPDTAAVQEFKTYKMKKAGRDRWTLTVKGDQLGKEYTFDIGRGETPGVFAKAVTVNGQSGVVVDMAQTNPAGWDQDTWLKTESPVDLVLYEMHHRDFSIDVSSGLKNKGKFLALTEPKAIAHLKKLGVNAVHILPSFDFATIDETRPEVAQYNWGYDPLNYNVPEGSYSTDAATPTVRIREFKQMVQALHKAGIRVILDVVYNHTNNIENGNFDRTYPDYYYRRKADGTISDGTGCGNETASEKPLMRQFIKESMVYWTQEYHIDGFRVDLMGVHDIETMNEVEAAVRAVNPSTFIYGEGWSAGACALPTEQLAVKANTRQLNNIAAFSDDMRDALRGPFNDDHKTGFIGGVKGMEESIKFGIAGAVEHPQVDISKVNYSKAAWANNPTQQVSYVSCHDDMCLVDRLLASVPDLSQDELIRLDLLAQTAVLTAQGVPFILSGEEMLRDKKGVHNSYKSPDLINHLDWQNLERYPEVFRYYSGLIALRKNHPAFRLRTAEEVRRHLEFFPTHDCVVAFQLKDNAGGDRWKNIIVVLNGNRQSRTLDLPAGEWTVVACDGEVNEAGIGDSHRGVISVAAQSAVILHD